MRGPTETFDVVVLGAGPAACAAARTLAGAGRHVVLLDRDAPRRPPVGETLPPAAGPLLRALGVLDAFRAGPHLPGFGNVSAWGSEDLHGADFIRDPNGHGWHLDRSAFDALLRTAAQDAGAVLCSETAPVAVDRAGDDLWRLTAECQGDSIRVSAPWLVDGTGRAGWLSRRLGVRRRHYDKLVGYVSVVRSGLEDEDRTTLVEAAPEGWWYTAAVPGGARVVAYLTDAGTPTGRLAASADGFASLLCQTRHARVRVSGGDIAAINPRVAPAHTARAERCAGDGWLAVGDAALSFDPLSSQGLFHALATGLDAGRTVDAALAGQENASDDYEASMTAVFEAYRHHRTGFYRQEQRWPASPFWQRRHTGR